MTDPSQQPSEQHHHDLGSGGRPRSMSVRDVLGPASPSALRRALRCVPARPATAVRVAAGVAGLSMIALTYLLVADAVVGAPSAFGEEAAGVVQSNPSQPNPPQSNPPQSNAVLTRAEPWADRMSAPAASPGAGTVTSAMASPDVPASGSAATVPALTGAAATAPVSPGAPLATITSTTVPPPPAPTEVFDDIGGGHGSDEGSDDDGSDDDGDDDDHEPGDDRD